MEFHDDLSAVVHWLVREERILPPKLLKRYWKAAENTGRSFDESLVAIIYDNLPKPHRELAGEYAHTQNTEILSENSDAISFLCDVGFLQAKSTRLEMPKLIQKQIAVRHQFTTSITD